MPLENSNKKDKIREKEKENLDENNYLVEESLIKIKEARSFSDFICMCVIAELNHNNYKPLSNTNEIAKEDWNDFDFILSQIKDGKLEIKLENGKLKFDVDYDKKEVKSSLLDLNDNLVYTRAYPYKQKNMEQEKNFPETISKDSKQIDSSKKGNFLTEEFDKDKNLYKIGNLKDGLKEGKWTFYYLEGELKEEREYKNGSRNGLCKEYSKEGKIERISNYKDGIKDGEYKEFDYNEKLCLEGTYSNGKKDGLWKNYETSEFLLYKDDMLIDKNSKDFFQTKESNFETHILSEKKEIESPWEKKIENDKAESFER